MADLSRETARELLISHVCWVSETSRTPRRRRHGAALTAALGLAALALLVFVGPL